MLKLKKKNSDTNTLLTQFPAKSGYAESFRTMRTNLQFTSLDKDLKSICVTSATEEEGKTNTVANLAYTIAQTGQRVLMVDCDLRKPGLTKRFNQENISGLTELISQKLGMMISDGSFGDMQLNDLIQLTLLQKRTGILSINDDTNQVDISFSNGDLVDIYWKNRPEQKKLASSLISNNLLTKEQAQIAIGHQKKSVQKLGTILVTMGMISKNELKKYLSVHIVEAFQTAFSMPGARFAFTKTPNNKINTNIDRNVNFNNFSVIFLMKQINFLF